MDLSKIKNTPIGLFKVAFSLLDAKCTFVCLIVFVECLQFITTWAMLTEQLWLVIVSVIVIDIANAYVMDYFVRLRYVIRKKWKLTAYRYFTELSQQSRQNTDINSFRTQVQSTGNTLSHIVSWGFRTIIKVTAAIINCLVTIYYNDKATYIIILVVLVPLYYLFRMCPQQRVLVVSQKAKKNIEKTLRPFNLWLHQLFKNNNKTAEELLDINEPLIHAELGCVRGLRYMLTELCIFVKSVNGLILYAISNTFKDLSINKVLFDKLSNSIENAAHLATTISDDIREFDTFMNWINSSGSACLAKTQVDITLPENIQSNIVLKSHSGTLIVTANNLSFTDGAKILIKGVSGSGKTQFMNSLTGLIPGTNFENTTADMHLNAYCYMDQGIRESVPKTGLTLVTMLQMTRSIENDRRLMELIKIVLLDDKFNLDNLDLPMSALSGGELMRLSILYTLWEFKTKNKQILVLDEPEQGLDECIRVKVIHNILTNIKKPVILIYHGSKLDLLQLPFTKVWHFDTVSEDRIKETNVREQPFDEYKKELRADIMRICQKF